MKRMMIRMRPLNGRLNSTKNKIKTLHRRVFLLHSAATIYPLENHVGAVTAFTGWIAERPTLPLVWGLTDLMTVFLSPG